MDYSVSFGSLKVTSHAIGNCRTLVGNLRGAETSKIAEIITKAFLKNPIKNTKGRHESIVKIGGQEYKILYCLGNVCHIITFGKEHYHYLH